MGEPLDYEKLGAFYLGRTFDPVQGQTRPEPLLYDAKDLTTHAVCVGMTGSGKTGLCVSLLEEAAIDGIPTIAIDPKGDLGNLMLTFPDLDAKSFLPWIDESEAARDGASVPEYAARVARRWREGLGAWGQDGARIQRLRDAADISIYTPGSSAGKPLAVLRSFDPPPDAVLAEADLTRERISALASSLLGLLGIDADPVQSREHVLLSNIVHTAWMSGKGLDLADLVKQIQRPPFERLGVLDLEVFYPAKDRAGLAMRLNGLLASPGFGVWLDGEPLSAERLLWTAEGKPRISIINIAHLSDEERIFVVTVLLDEVVAWMRTQPGSSGLRALLYMDEVYGFFPPSAKPPCKKPMLTLLKQARAYGLGVVLSTQNPVDLDYKALSNAGTWFLGRLQTERDVMRVIDGLEGAAQASGRGFDRGRITKMLAGLKSRVFLMNNVHEDEPVLFQTRWAMSYLRGPLTRIQIKTLQGDAAPPTRRRKRRRKRSRVAGASVRPPAGAASSDPSADDDNRPDVEAEVPEFFARPSSTVLGDVAVIYRPWLLGVAELHYVLARSDIDVWRTRSSMASLEDLGRRSPWTDAALAEDTDVPALDSQPIPGARFAALPRAAARSKSYGAWEKSLRTFFYRNAKISLRKCTKLKMIAELGETEAQFAVRVREAIRARRDLRVEKLRKRYTPKLAKLTDRIKRAEEKVAREKDQVGQQTLQTAISAGSTMLGAIFGRKLASVGNVGRAASTARSASRIAREKQDVVRAESRLEDLQERLTELEEEFRADLDDASELGDSDDFAITVKALSPRKSDVEVTRLALVWVPEVTSR